MSGASRVLGLARSLVAWSVLVSPTLAWGAEATLVQQIGELSGEVAEAVAAEVAVVPFSPEIDARTTPIILAPSEAFVVRGRPGQVGGLSRAERRALRQAYDAGQTILLLHATVHDIEALHVLVKDGVTHQSTSDPAVLAYALRQESDIPTVRVVHNVRPSVPAPGGVGPQHDDEGALQRALDVVISELIHPPVVGATVAVAQTTVDLGDNPVQTATITSTTNGVYNMPVFIYALHSCQDLQDHYVVDTGGDWAATEAQFTSASANAGQIHVNPSDLRDPTVDLQSGEQYCTGGLAIEGAGADQRLCRYTPYPQYYEVDIVPPNGPTVVQVDAEPAADQGRSTSYSSGFSFNLGGGVNISGDGPSAGIQAGVTWDNETSTTVPPLVIEAGDTGNEGAFTRYHYCTSGTTVDDCVPTIQMVTPPDSGLCQNFAAGQPESGQTPEGRLSGVAQTVHWQVDPATYGGSATFDITVTWQANFAFSQVLLWNGGPFVDPDSGQQGDPSTTTGYCNFFGCSCSMPHLDNPDQHSLTFNVPKPSQNCSGG